MAMKWLVQPVSTMYVEDDGGFEEGPRTETESVLTVELISVLTVGGAVLFALGSPRPYASLGAVAAAVAALALLRFRLRLAGGFHTAGSLGLRRIVLLPPSMSSSVASVLWPG